MPQHKSCDKRVKTAAKANLRNQIVKSRVKTAEKKVVLAKGTASVGEALKNAYSELDKAVKFGVIHKNKAANHKSNLAVAAAKAAAVKA